MRHRLPGRSVGYGGIVAVDADRLLRGLLGPHPPKWIEAVNLHGLVRARKLHRNRIRDLVVSIGVQRVPQRSRECFLSTDLGVEKFETNPPRPFWRFSPQMHPGR